MGILQKNYKDFFFFKQDFFYMSEGKKRTPTKIALAVSYGMILDMGYLLIEQELQHLLLVLQKKQYDILFWQYAEYLAILLERYHLAREEKEKAQVYALLQERLREAARTKKFFPSPVPQAICTSFPAYLYDRFIDNIVHFSQLITSLDRVKGSIAYYNVDRLYWTFCRLTMVNIFKLAYQAQWFTKFDLALKGLLGIERTTDVFGFIQAWEGLNGVFRILSVVFFAARLLLNISDIANHTFFPSKEEAQINLWQRFQKEVSDKPVVLLNDAMWTSVNLVANFPEISGLSATNADIITAVFLVGDILLLLLAYTLTWRQYRCKQEQYREELSLLLMQADSRIKQQKMEILQQQLQELEQAWQVNAAALRFNIAAASLLVTCYSLAAFVAITPLMISAFAGCILGVGMYMSDKEFRHYKEAQLRYEEVKTTARTCFWKMGEEKAALAKEYSEAKWKLGKAIAINTVVPALFMGVMLLSFEAALVLTVLYGVYKLYGMYGNYQKIRQPQSTEKSCFALSCG